MKILLIACLLLLGWPRTRPDQDFPHADISNGLVSATVLLPDPAAGYYQATRFDWSGLIRQLEYKKHSYFGQWFKQYDAKRHDAVCGPVEEFDPVGYEDAKAGENFLKIGVGMLCKKDGKPYSSFTLYETAQPGSWQVKKGRDFIEFVHELKGTDGYAYRYHKTLRLVKGKPELVLEHRLQNTGSRPLETKVYDHNFFMIDQHPSGPGLTIRFPFEPQGQGRGLGTIGTLSGKQIVYLRNIEEKEDMYFGSLTGYGNSAADYDFRIENDSSGAGVRIRADQPLAKMVFWACSTASCPEPYIHLKAEPGQECRWKIMYEFYETSR